MWVYIVYEAPPVGIKTILYAGTDKKEAYSTIPESPYNEQRMYQHSWIEVWDGKQHIETISRCEMYGHDFYMDKDDPKRSSCNHCGVLYDLYKEKERIIKNTESFDPNLDINEEKMAGYYLMVYGKKAMDAHLKRKKNYHVTTDKAYWEKVEEIIEKYQNI